MSMVKRKPLRLAEYDYSSIGAYFITVCTKDKAKILSHIVGDGSPVPELTEAGKIVFEYIQIINSKYPTVFVDKFVIMPNHIHLLLSLTENNGTGNPSPTTGTVMGWFKYNATKAINETKDTIGKSIFQRSYHDHIIRNQHDYDAAWQYIDDNPAKWHEDPFYI